MTKYYIENPTTIFVCNICRRVLKIAGMAADNEPERHQWRTSPGLFDDCEQHECDRCVKSRTNQVLRWEGGAK